MKQASWKGFDAFLKTVLEMEIPEGGVALFRGQPVSAPLLPKLVRSSPLTDVAPVERRMLRHLRNRSTLLLGGSTYTDLQLLALAQHHGMATRLLDWSSNPLVALWFACAEPHSSKSGHIYVYRVYPENIETPTSLVDPFSLSMTRVFKPDFASDRIDAQQGWFSIHPCMGGAFGYKAACEDPIHFLSIFHLEIPAPEKISILEALEKMGISADKLFPGLDGLCRQTNWAFIAELPGLEKRL